MVGSAAPDDAPARNRRPSRRRDLAQPTYGYHNTFHTHAEPSIAESPPPSYERATSTSHFTTSTDAASADQPADVLPKYYCSVECWGTLALRCELASPFLESYDSKWHDVFVVLHGTQLNFHKLKTSVLGSKSKPPAIGRLIRSYSLQHAEVGVAADWRKGELVPRSPLAKIVPTVARQKLWETDPDLFEPIREWVIRLRLETEQVLLCAPSQDVMLCWVECLCAAMDIAQPLEDRSEPRYRSLPRRNRRQREIEGVLDHLDNLQGDEAGRRFVEQQERLIRRLYPHLARESSSAENQADPGSRYPSSNEPDSQNGASQEDPDTEDLDPADVTEGSPLALSEPAASSSDSNSPAPPASESEEPSQPAEPEPFNPKTAPAREPPTPAAQLRYRKRCAPILLSSSPRASEIVFYNNRRLRIDTIGSRLVPFEMSPPRYDVGSYKHSMQPLASVVAEASLLQVPSRPTIGERGTSDTSYLSADTSYSFDEDLLRPSGEIATLHTRGSSGNLGHGFHLDGTNDLNIDRIESNPDSIESAPPSPVPSEMAGKFKGKSILSVWKVKPQHSTTPDMALQNAHIPLVV